jgi:competence protein ComEA
MDILRKLVLALLLISPLVSFAGEAVDINTANQETLMTVKGIGEKRAAAIIAYRDKYGSFKSVDALSDVQGVSESLVEKSRETLTVSTSK